MRIHHEPGKTAPTRHDATTTNFLEHDLLTPPDALVDSLSIKKCRYAGSL